MTSPFPIDRRRLVMGLGMATLLPSGCASRIPGPQWVSAQGADDASFSLVGASPDGSVTEVSSGFRGHGLAVHPFVPGHVVMFARRPGVEGLVVDLGRGKPIGRIRCPSGLRMQGHGAFSADGARLYGTLADEETAEGVVGVWRTDTWDPIDELPSYGLGPHELRFLPDGQTLVVANGGLLTRPETGREVLNLDTMDSSVVLIDAASGKRVDAFRIPVPKASLRHLGVTDDGTVVVGAQIQREAVGHEDVLPLVAALRAGEAPVVFDAPAVLAAMVDYVGSVAVSSRSRIAATSSPRGNLVLFWDLDRGTVLGSHAFNDVSGLAVDESTGTFVLSSSSGQVRNIDTTSLEEDEGARRDFDVRWDNHLTLVTL